MDSKILTAWRRQETSKNSRLVRVDEVAVKTNPKDDESPSETALRNGLILQKIFQNIPTDSLQFSCSFVNKTWNTEARKIIRDDRRCNARSKRKTLACYFLQDFGNLCDEIAKAGRAIQFNGLKLNLHDSCDEYQTPCEQVLYGNLTSHSEIKLKHLELNGGEISHLGEKFGYPEGHCEFHKPVLTLLKRKSHELRRLKVNCITLLHDVYDARGDWTPEFPQLEMFSVRHVYLAEEPNADVVTMKETIQWLLKNAPNLKQIAFGDVSVLKVIPDNILANVELKLPHSFQMWCEDSEELELLRLISEKAFNVSWLHVKVSTLFDIPDYNYDRLDELDEQDTVRQFHAALERLLQNNHEQLEWSELYDPYPLGHLSHPPLRNLTRLTINKCEEGYLDAVWNAIVGIDFETAMPTLAEVEIDLKTENRWLRTEGLWNVWPPVNNSNIVVPYCCTTVRNLEILIESQAVNVRPLQALFPNVSHLSFKFVDSRTDEADFAMLIQIFECWSDLETLGCSVECGNWGSRSIQKPPRRNYDADFLGIHEEEAELLRQKDEEFLRRVHIVPIRPSVLTMSKLRRVSLHNGFFYGPQAGGGGQNPSYSPRLPSW